MALILPGHSAPAVGFEVPLEILAACHGRVQRQCETLLRLVAHVQAHGADRPAQEAAAAVMRYFDTAARTITATRSRTCSLPCWSRWRARTRNACAN